MTNHSPTWNDLDAKEWLMTRMRQHRENAVHALRALPPEQVVSVLSVTLPMRTDLSADELRRLLDVVGPMHQEAWANEIKAKHDNKPAKKQA